MAYMTRMVIDAPGRPLRLTTSQIPEPIGTDVLIKVAACGVCRTDLHVADGEITARYPVVPGHEIVGRVIAVGPGSTHLDIGDRVGVPWLGRTCGICPYCRSGHENLCDQPTFTGATRDGGYASHVLADSRFCLPIPPAYDDAEAAPLLCAGLIGYRSLVMAGQGKAIGLYGFGAAAHIIAQVAVWQGRAVYAFTRPGDRQAQDFALKLGCRWAGGSDEPAPEPLDAAIIFAAVGALVPIALKAVRKGGRVVCAGIHMSDIPSFPYADLWGERSILSVANLTREDGLVFLDIAPKVPVRTSVTRFKLEEANEALAAVREGRLEGAAVLIP
ncbi:zinc-dependent alcohol dehydrogenase family protein [Sphingomonas pruni]|uniref:zinc-dependent alcohol dehydrogenase family protein n=1 Tax=Sphingomonas pruni TaxID=40683 RepID=UPI000834BDC4